MGPASLWLFRKAIALRETKLPFTRYRAAVLTYNSGDFAAFFVTERNCAALPVAYRIGFCHTRCSSVP